MDTMSDLLFSTARGRLAPVLRWLDDEVLPPRPALRFATPSRVIWEHPLLVLRDFGGAGGDGPPILVVPPEVNGVTVADYGPGQSLVQTLLAAGFSRVLLAHWRSATESTKDAGLADSIDALRAAVDIAGPRVHLLGICQGGWEAAIVAALAPDRVISLTVGAAAIDTSVGETPLIDLVARTGPSVYAAMVALGGGVMRGDFLRFGFDTLQAWDRFVVGPWRSWNDGDDPSYRERRATMDAWYRSEKDLPGTAYLESVERIFRSNELCRGVFTHRGEGVDLSAIRCRVAMIAGSRDHLSPPEQVFRAESAMQPESARRWLVDAGHIGVFVGREALRRAWPELLAWVREAEARGDGPIAAAPVPTLPGPTTSGDVPAAPARGRPRARARAGSTD